jgi:hypothetical protein
MNQFFDILNDALRIATFQHRFSERPDQHGNPLNARIETCQSDAYLGDIRSQAAFASTRARQER